MGKSAIVRSTGGPSVIVVDEPGSTLNNNWCGCNEGPNMPGCDTANFGATFDPWLIMTLEISPNPARVGNVAHTIDQPAMISGLSGTAGSLFPMSPITTTPPQLPLVQITATALILVAAIGLTGCE